MKKFLSVLVSLMLCVCLLAPAVSAADTSDLDTLIAKLEGFDIDSLSPEDIGTIIGVDDMGTVESVIGQLTGANTAEEKDPASMISDIAGSLMGSDDSAEDAEILNAISGVVGFDISALAEAVEGDDAFSSILAMLGGADAGELDTSALSDMISGAFGDAGLDLGALTAGLDLGAFDITSILGSAGDSSASGSATDTISSIMEAITSGLEMLGLDTSMISGLLDSDIVNFFANMFIGLGGDSSSDTTGAVVVTPTEATQSSVSGTKSPKTGDTSSVFAALATISVASAAVFVCLGSKKRNEE